MTKKSTRNTAKRYTEEEIAEAKKMYMEYETISEISRQTNITRQTITHHAKKWKAEREIMRADLLDRVISAKSADFANMTIAAINVMTRALTDLATREQAPSINEAKRATEILEVLDKITRLDHGEPTEITAEKPIKRADIEAKFRLDPFNVNNEVTVETTGEIDYEQTETEPDSGSDPST